MKRNIKIGIFSLTAICLLTAGLIVIMAAYPSLLYASKTVSGNYTVYHDSPLDKDFMLRLTQVDELLKPSELYDPQFKFDICLNDGSFYPTFLRNLRGQAFAWGFYNKIVVMGKADYTHNAIELNGYRWNMAQLLAHEAMHCLQFHRFGLWKSNPVAQYPDWKWEGYPEYIARRKVSQSDFAIDIARSLDADTTDHNSWAIPFADTTIAPREYYGHWLLVRYCLDIQKVTYTNLLQDTTTEQVISEQMMGWYAAQKAQH